MKINITGDALKLFKDFLHYGKINAEETADAMMYDYDGFCHRLGLLEDAYQNALAEKEYNEIKSAGKSIMSISVERINELRQFWGDETNEDWMEEWRDDLDDEEAALVDSWDLSHDKGVYNLCKRIVELDEKRKSRES